jgi:arylsulfatase
MVDRYRNRIRQTASEMMAEIDAIGGPRSDTDYPMGWAMVANTPFRGFKGETDAGGTRVPLILSWPGHLPAGELRTQFHHVIDLAPTLYELTGVERPSIVDGVGQTPMQGTSMAYTFSAPAEPTRHRVQYWENAGKRAIWRDGWLAVDLHRGAEGEWSNDGWELYDTRTDFSLARDRAAEKPDLAREMAELWWSEARANNVLPLDDRRFEKTLDSGRPKAGAESRRHVYRAGASAIPAATAPQVAGRTHVLTARVHVPARGAEGVLACFGSRFGGWTLYVRDRRLVYAHNFLGMGEARLISDREVPGGDATLSFRFTPTEPGFGRGELFIDGEAAGALDGIQTSRLGYIGDEGLQIGRNEGSPVSGDYEAPFAWTGGIEDVVLELPE